jgi:predicted XRE-type DNA-binding protein
MNESHFRLVDEHVADECRVRCATVEAETRPLFSKPRRHVVLRLLCQRLAALIRQDHELIGKIIAECQSQAAAFQRPDSGEIGRLEKLVGDLTRKVEYNRRNPGETEEELKESAAILRRLGAERNEAQNQLALIQAIAAEPVRVPTESEVRDMLRHLDDVLRRAAASQLGDDQDAARDILETLTGGRIDMFQQGERKEMQGWLRGHFTAKILDVLVEMIAGIRSAKSGEGVEVVLDFKRPRKTDADSDKAIEMWFDGDLQKKVAEKLGTSQGYVSKLLRIGAERRGTTLENLRAQRKTRPPGPARTPRYQRIAEEVKTLWWDELFPYAVVAQGLHCSTVTVTAAVRHWFESRGVPVPTLADWSRRLEERVVQLFDENALEIHEIAETVHLGRTKVMEIVRDVYHRLGKELPDGRTRRSHLRKGRSTTSDSSIHPAPRELAGRGGAAFFFSSRRPEWLAFWTSSMGVSSTARVVANDLATRLW